ncbi:hypothetical protein Aeqsu_1651 [Aequorivita sublithincola DSM 14238]|uniref:GIY-YIG domain-containing protein n=1 Tax=Aequorivita sublithincola (strain DSM 14238 / LMG 21431 / ACAM 643 / 9-3) TaxID=746697 RepID=I3YVW6_AEQSU|nr:hypothetical protein [Aequorivita sublithincola]AFL81134.1 hypothetical protein Aeqsu_1651 [Aequorivita sublithincola DSM 14238]
MTYTGPYTYDLTLESLKDDRLIATRIFEGAECRTFKKPVTNDKTPKIYVLQADGKTLYIGYTSQSISTRLRDGLKKAGTFKDYKGYKWKDSKSVKLSVFVFNHKLIGKRCDEDIPFIDLAEAVEAELVYLVRQKTGRWPEFQNEIHFNNEERERAKEITEDFYNKIMK